MIQPWDTDEVLNKLTGSALNLGNSSDYGYGLVQAYVALTYSGYPEPQNNPPIASFTYSCTNLECSFDGSGSSDSDGSIDMYFWNFGESESSTVQNHEYTYSSEGSYDVTLTVKDNGCATNSIAQSANPTSQQ